MVILLSHHHWILGREGADNWSFCLYLYRPGGTTLTKSLYLLTIELPEVGLHFPVFDAAGPWSYDKDSPMECEQK